MAAHLIAYPKRHELPNENAIPIFNHIPKCGGSSLEVMMSEHCQRQGFRPSSLTAWDDFLAKRKASSPELPKYFSGHCIYGVHNFLPDDSSAFYFTFLREPLSRTISLVKFGKYYWCEPNLDPNSFILNTLANPMIRHLGQGDKGLAEHRLFEEAVFFGITERYGDSLSLLSIYLPWLDTAEMEYNNISKSEDLELNKSTIDYFMEANRDDIELYDKAVKEFGERFKDMPQDKRHAGKDHNQPPLSVKRNDPEKQKELKKRIIQIVTEGQDDPSDLNIKAIPHYAFMWVDDKKKLHDFLIRQIERKNVMLDCKNMAFFCSLSFASLSRVQELTDDLLDEIAKLDIHDHIPALINYRIKVLSGLLDYCLTNKATAIIPEHRLKWIRTIQSVKGWKARALKIEAKIMEMNGSIDSAISHVRQAAGIEPYDFEAKSMLYRLLMSKNDLDGAIAACKDLLAFRPDYMEFHGKLADLLIRRGRIEEVEETALKAMDSHPNLAWPYYQYSRVLEIKGDLSKGQEYAEKAVEKQPHKMTFAANLAAFMRKQRDYSACTALCRGRLEENPQQGWAWRELCRCAHDTGDYEKALEYGAEAIAVHPEDAEFRDYYDKLAAPNR